MRITSYGHSCLLVEDGDGRALVDPGTLSPGFEDLDGLTGVLVTHQHPDHVDPERLGPLLERNPDAVLVCDPGTPDVLGDLGATARVVRAGETLDLGLPVQVHGEVHAVVHPDIPTVPNVAYLLGGRLLHPGDSWTRPAGDVEVLAVPVSAPWLKVAEAVDYVRAVGPRVAVPIHAGMLTTPQLPYGILARLAPAGTEVRVLGHGTPLER